MRRLCRSYVRYSLLVLAAGIIACGPTIAQQRRQGFVDTHPELSPALKSDILNGQVVRGMTMDQVRAVWGSPPPECATRTTALVAIWSYCHKNLAAPTLVFFDSHGRVTNLQIPSR
jgi:hypothetical protein